MRPNHGATALATRHFFSRFTGNLDNDPGRPSILLGKTNLSVSRIGFGGYRVSDEDPAHNESLRLALSTGTNLIDTSTNYTDGHSEKLIGLVLKEMFGAGKTKRQEVVVVTKVGYVQGENLKIAKQYESENRAFEEMVKFQPGCWHCISPEFLEHQISASLERLQLEQIDVLLLHNPEYFLKTESNHAEYYRRIKQAFEYLETEVVRGRIQFYGVSSNTFTEPRESADYTSLETLLELAEAITPQHHFSVVQCPFNFMEPGAAFEENNSGKTLLEFAQLKNLGVLINRPLNAFFENQLIRLASFRAPDARAELSFRSALEKALALETELHEKLPSASSIPLEKKELLWAHILKKNLSRLTDLDTFKQLLEYQIEPELNHTFIKFSVVQALEAEFRAYDDSLRTLFRSISLALEAKAARRSQQIAELLDEACPALKNTPKLSQKSLRLYQSIPGIHCILLGMRRPEYVRDIKDLQAVSNEEAMTALDHIQNQLQRAVQMGEHHE